MHSITLDIAAGILLVSSVASLGLLLKRTPKSRLSSSISVLSISDITSSVLIAIMILLHRYFTNDGNPVSYRINKINRSARFYGTIIKGRYHFKDDGSNGDAENNESDGECDYKSVFFQYAMFIVPFANAFTSLLSFSTNYYLNTSQIDRRCCKWYETLTETKRTAGSDAKDSVQALESGLPVPREDDDKVTNVLERMMDFKFANSKYALLAILGQWIVPAVFSGAFKLAERENVRMTNRSSEDLICALVANFPFEDCMDDFHLENENSPSINDYISSEDNLMWANFNSTETDDIISRVHSIMQSMLDVRQQISYKNESRQEYYNLTQLLDIANSDGVGKNSTAPGNQSFVDEDPTVPKSRLLRRIIQEGLIKHKYRIGAAKVERELYNITSLTLPNNTKPFHCMNNRCVMSMQFLKANLFIFLILVYFTPIFVSALLLVISYYKCREITGKLEENEVQNNLIKGEEIVSGEEGKSSNIAGGSPTGWFPSNEEEEPKQDATSGVQKNENQLSENFSRCQKMKWELSCQTEKMQNFFQIFKVNALLAVVLWTPFFLQVLSKVLFCSNVPKWLMETTFLATIVFAIFRNAVDLNMLKIKADAEDYSKQPNSVHPNV